MFEMCNESKVIREIEQQIENVDRFDEYSKQQTLLYFVRQLLKLIKSQNERTQALCDAMDVFEKRVDSLDNQQDTGDGDE